MKEYRMEKEVKLLDVLKPEIELGELTDKANNYIDQTTSGKLTCGSIDQAFSTLTNSRAKRDVNLSPHYLFIPPKSQNMLRSSEHFISYVERHLDEGVIGRYKGALVSANPALDYKSGSCAIVTGDDPENSKPSEIVKIILW